MTNAAALFSASELAEGGIRADFLPNGKVIAVYRVDGRFYATDDTCTHGAASLSEEGTLTGHMVLCSWHNGSFDIRTGEPCGSPCSVPLKTYPVRIVDGFVNVEFGND